MATEGDGTYDGLDSLLSSTASSVAVSRLIGTMQPGSLVQDRLAAHLVSEDYYKSTVQAMQALADTNTVQFYATPPTSDARPPCDLICLRTRFIDDELVDLVNELAQGADSGVQVVVLGAGMDSRPWRLAGLPPNVTWFEVDMPDVTRAKASRLFQAGAQLDDGPAILPGVMPVPNAHQGPAFPLIVTRWRAVGADLRAGQWVGVLQRRGFEAHTPTVWVVEGLLYYLEECEAVAVLRQAAAATAPGTAAALIATHMNDSMLKNWQAMARHEPAYAAATTFRHAMTDQRPHAVLDSTPWRHLRTMSQPAQESIAEEYKVALVRSAADTRYAEQHGSSRYFVLEAVLRDGHEECGAQGTDDAA